MDPLNVFIVDDDAVDANYLSCILEGLGDITIGGIESDPHKALQSILIIKPDVLFLDVEMPLLSGFDIIKLIRSHNVYPAIILITNHLQYGIKALRENVFDYLVKPVNKMELFTCIERLRERVKRRISIVNQLNEAEADVLKLVCDGLTSTQIGNELHLSPHTVNYYRSNVLKKAGVNTTAELISVFTSLRYS